MLKCEKSLRSSAPNYQNLLYIYGNNPDVWKDGASSVIRATSWDAFILLCNGGQHGDHYEVYKAAGLPADNVKDPNLIF